MEKIFDALISQVVPENKLYIPAWIMLSLSSIIGSVFRFPLLNDFKTPLFYLFTLAVFAFWAQIIILFSNFDAKRQLQKDVQSKKKYIKARAEQLHIREQEIFREFLAEKGQIVKIDGLDPYIDRLCDDEFLTLIGEQTPQSHTFQISPVAQQIIRIRHIFPIHNAQRLHLSSEQQECLLLDAIGGLKLREDALIYLQAHRHFSKRRIPPQPRPVGTYTKI